MIGALIIQTLTSTIYAIGVPPEINLVVKAVVVFAVMLLQSREFRRQVRALASRRPREARDERRSPCCRPRGLRVPPVVASVALLLAMVAFGSVMYTGFFSAQVFLNLLIDNAFLLVVAVGMTFVILDRRHRPVGGLGGGADDDGRRPRSSSTATGRPGVVIPLVLAGGAVFGAFQGWLIQRFRLQPFIVTLAGMFLARGLCYVISIDSISITEPTFTAHRAGARRRCAAARRCRWAR